MLRRFTASLLALVLGAAAAVALVSCGGGNAELLPGDTAKEITANLDAVAQLAGSGDCAGAQSQAQQVSEQIDALGGVDKGLKQALRDGATRLNEVVANCAATTPEVTAPSLPATTESTAPSEKPKKEKKPKKDETTPTTPTTTTPTVPTTPTQTTPTTPTTPTEPPSGGGGTGAPPGGVGPGAAGGGD
jgi:outer membrane biosynthesis protein TonB